MAKLLNHRPGFLAKSFHRRQGQQLYLVFAFLMTHLRIHLILLEFQHLLWRLTPILPLPQLKLPQDLRVYLIQRDILLLIPGRERGGRRKRWLWRRNKRKTRRRGKERRECRVRLVHWHNGFWTDTCCPCWTLTQCTLARHTCLFPAKRLASPDLSKQEWGSMVGM